MKAFSLLALTAVSLITLQARAGGYDVECVTVRPNPEANFRVSKFEMSAQVSTGKFESMGTFLSAGSGDLVGVQASDNPDWIIETSNKKKISSREGYQTCAFQPLVAEETFTVDAVLKNTNGKPLEYIKLKCELSIENGDCDGEGVRHVWTKINGRRIKSTTAAHGRRG